jgi:hypothetical protein
MRIIGWCGIAAAFALVGCQGDDHEAVPAIYFEMYLGGNQDPGPFNAAWTAAREDPGLGVAYDFPLVTADMEPGTPVRLLAGRSTNDPGYPSTTGDDVILADQMHLATSAVGDDGRVVFPPLAVTTGSWTSDSGVIPATLLCGTTVIAARAFATGDGELPAVRFLAASFFVAVTSPCE